jgi:hypothetical protein
VQIKGHGILAHRIKCIYYEKCILNAFQNVKKFKQKFSDINLNILYSFTKDLWVKKFLVAM